MRIITGKFRGRTLVKSDLKTLRPTTDKNRETLFNILTSGKIIREIGFKIIDAEVLDVCCGTGAIGFEALSRGAKFITLIDNNFSHLEIAKKNSEVFAVENQTTILRADAKRIHENKKFFDLVFIDPPYKEDYPLIIKNLLEKNWIQKNSLVVIEAKTYDMKKFNFENLQLLEMRESGSTAFGFYQLC
jgi:16S rRNA (guanine966-N2)-methyltransferase